MGLSVALIEPTDHIGGMVTGGLSATDHGDKIVTGGYALEFYRRIGKKYGVPLFWYPEPRVAEAVLHEMLNEQKNVHLFMRHRLRERGGVRKSGARITALVMESGARFRGKIFAEAGYEGDVMKQAGVSYTVGRQAATAPGVPRLPQNLFNGRDFSGWHIDVAASDSNSRRLICVVAQSCASLRRTAAQKRYQR
jgi:hypothetical protein